MITFFRWSEMEICWSRPKEKGSFCMLTGLTADQSCTAHGDLVVLGTGSDDLDLMCVGAL